MTPSGRALTSAAGALLLAASVSAEVARTPESPFFEAMIRPLLTPLDEVSEIETAAAEEMADAGVLVLEEELHVVDAGAKSAVAFHRVVKPLTDAGVEMASRLVVPYDASYQRIFLVTARTRAPDGHITDVGHDAAFIQTPQYQADQAIYSDSEELVVLFSNVKPGHLIEWVVVVEDSEPRMPGCWGAVIRPGAFWPSVRFRSRVDIEEPLASSLRMAPRGGPLPATTTPPARPGWRAWEWIEHDSPPMRPEIKRAPTAQFGRAIRLTTVASWDEVARWYGELLASRSRLAPELGARVDQWTNGLDDPRQILDVLLRKVADDVRYTGLEFGLGALRPRAPEVVWSSQYGDCKDKSNLLRVMLARRGIDSHIVLVNTEHAGRIEPGAPHFAQFNHAILAVDLPAGRVFCDPTVPSLPAGVLRPSSTGRQALLIGDRDGELLTIPIQDGGAVRYAFQLEVGPSHDLKGWMEISAEGSISALFADFFKSIDASSRHQQFHVFVDRFFEGADLIDVEFPGRQDPGTPAFLARGYFVVNGVQPHDGRSSALLRFPHGGMVFPAFADEDVRETPWYQDRELTEVEIRYLLPDGWREQSPPPQPLKVSSPAATADARWRRGDDNTLTASLAYRTEIDLVDPQEFPRLRQAVTATRAWMDRPVTVAATGDESPRSTANATPEVDLPLMPTGEGQLRLVDRSYPAEGDRDLRRAALLQVQLLFPDSTETVFDTEIWLAQLDAFDGHQEQAVSRVERVLDMYGDAVPRETVAWARYHLASHLYDTGETERAIAIFESLAGNESLTPFRRATASEMLGAILAEAGDAPAAVRVLDDAIAMESEMHAELHDLRARILVREELLEDLRSSLVREMEVSPHLADWTFESLVGTVGDLTDEGDPSDAASLAGVLLAVADASPQLQLDEQRRADLVESSRATLAYSEIAAAIGRYLEEPSSDWIRDAARSTPTGTAAEMAAAMERFDAEGLLAEYIRCGLERLARHGTAVGDFGSDLWQLAAVTEAYRPEDPVLDELIGWGLLLPESDEYRLETILVQARQIERRGDGDQAVALLRQWSANREVGPVYQVSFLAQLGLFLEHQGRWEEALETYRLLEPGRDTNLSGYDALLRAVFLDLGLGRYDEALRVIGLLADLDEELLYYCDSPNQIAELVALAEYPERARKFWSLQRDWMPVWQSLERAVGLEPAPELVVPVIPDAVETASEMGRAVNAGTSKAYFEIFRTFVHAARWQPEMVFEVCSLAETSGRMAGDHADLVQALTVALTTGLDFGDESIFKRSRQVLASYYVNQQQYPQAVAVGRQYFDRFEADDPLGKGILRLWGVAAAESGLDREVVAERLQRQLADEDLDGVRTVTVYVLAHLYQAMGLAEQELELIKTEVIDGEPDNAGFAERLENRYAALLDEPAEQSGFTAAVEGWFSTFGPPWYDAAAPESLQDPLAQTIERDIEQNPERFSRTELIKFRLLVARDPTRPILDRQQAFGRAVVDLEALCVSTSDADAMVTAVVEEKSMPAFVHSYVPWMALDTSFERGNRSRLERWLQSGLAATWAPGTRERMKRLAAGIPQPTDGPSELESAAANVLTDPVDDVGVRVLRGLTERLMQLGEFDLVAQFIDGLEKATFDNVTESGGAALRLDLRRRVAAYEAEWPSNEAMRRVVIEALGDSIFERPPVLDDVADLEHTDHLSDEQALAIRLYLAATRQYQPPSVFFWALLADGIRDLRGEEVTKQMLEAAVAAAERDDVRGQILRVLPPTCFDIDDPADRARLEELLAPSLGEVETPLSKASAVLMTGILDARAGREADLSAIEAAAREVDLPLAATRLRLVNARREGTPQLRRYLEGLPSDQLVDPNMIPDVLPALRTVGMEVEADLVAEVAHEHVRDEVLRSWSSLDGWSVGSVLSLCEALGDEGCIEETWKKQMVEAFSANDLSLRIELTSAELHGDWETARDAAAAIVAHNPKTYDAYWPLGRAEARLGNPAAAREALGTFVRYCRDSRYLQEAEGLLARLQGDGGP